MSGQVYRLIALYPEAVASPPPEWRGVPGVLGALWSERCAQQLPDAQVPDLQAVLEVRCARREALAECAARLRLGAGAPVVLETHEHTLVDRSAPAGGVKGVFLFRRRPDLAVDAFQAYWREQHGPLASRTPDITAYVQCHVLPESYAGNGAPPYDGVTELYWPDFDTMVDAMRSSSMTVEQAGDAPNFVERGSVAVLTVTERVWAPASAEPGVQRGDAHDRDE